MKRFFIALVLLLFWVQACGLISPATEAGVSSQALTAAAGTLFAEVTAASAPAPTEPMLVPPPIPPASTESANYQLKEERLIDAYAIRWWHDINNEIGFKDVVTIETGGKPSVRIDSASAIEDLTGTDINGDGYPEVIVDTYSGGAHCCFGTQVISLRDMPVSILQKPESNAGGMFQDLNGDGVYEFLTADDLFAYKYCPYAGSPFVRVIMAYDSSRDQYLPASPRFANQYAGDIQEHAAWAQQAQPGDHGEQDNTTKCAVLPLVLDYLYSGQQDKAHSELQRIYPYPDVESFWNEVLTAVQGSPLFIH
jgi:hypothetical protein